MSRRIKAGKGASPLRSATSAYSRGYWLLALSFFLALIAYYPALNYGFVYDDVEQITRNPAIRSWAAVSQYFSAHVAAGLSQSGSGSFYRPLFLLWLRCNYVLFHTSPWGYHLTSLLAHVAATGMFFIVARQWTEDGQVAGWAALLFAVHPIHIEAVAWISAVPEILFTIAGLASIHFYFRFLREKQLFFLAGSVALFALAVLAKETALVIWPVIFVCRWVGEMETPQESHVRWTATKEQLPFAAVTAGYCLLRAFALHGMLGHMTHSWSEVMCAVPSMAWFYLRKLALPVQLSQIYDDPDTWSFGSPHFFLPLIAVCLVAAALTLWMIKSKRAIFPALLLGMPLIPPMIGVSVFARHDLVHHRYLYLPSAGACLLLAIALRKAADPALVSLKPRAATVMVVLLSSVLVFSVWRQEKPYHDNVALFSHSVEIAPQSAIAWGLLGEEYMTRGQNELGIAAFQRAQILEPDVLLHNYRLASAYYLVGNMPWAEAYFQRALNTHHDPDVVTYDYCLYRLGLAQYAQGKMADAEATLRRATSLQPNGLGYHLALAAALKYEGNLAEARRQLELELRLGADEEASGLLRSINAQESGARTANSKPAAAMSVHPF